MCVWGGGVVGCFCMKGMKAFFWNTGTHHSILHGESQLILCVWPLDLDFDDGRARDGGELDGRLVLGVLQRRGVSWH